ncbi:MAG: aminoglycoside phosphotransferase family protein [Acidobacteriota bacterium]
MLELTEQNAAEYLLARGHGGAWQARSLGGGVSNSVLLLEDGARRWVLKQSLGQLRVEEEWLADRRRIWRECDALRRLSAVLPAGTVPSVVFEDREEFVFAMEAGPADAVDWKTQLLAGEVSVETARQVGALLRQMIAATWHGPEWFNAFGDQTCFDQLRLDPYYRFTATRHGDLAEAFADRIHSCRREAHALVHGDFSPKNLLVDTGGRVMLIDCEVIHFGDPGFDAGFLLNHLLLKSHHKPGSAAELREAAEAFWGEASKGPPDDERGWFLDTTMRHLACLHLARVDGKSPAEYLDAGARVRVREFARELVLSPAKSMGEVWDRLGA